MSDGWVGELNSRMSMILAMSAEPALLRVVATGIFSLAEAKRTFLEMLEAVAQHRVRKVLVDGRALRGKPQLMERFYYGEFAAQSVVKFHDRGVSQATQFAYVLRVPVLDPGRFGEMVAVNRGMRVKAFDDLDQALEWLGLAPPGKAS